MHDVRTSIEVLNCLFKFPTVKVHDASEEEVIFFIENVFFIIIRLFIKRLVFFIITILLVFNFFRILLFVFNVLLVL